MDVEVTQGVSVCFVSYRETVRWVQCSMLISWGAVVQGRKYLDYDLEALHVFLNQQQQQQSHRVVVAFQDSEAFESGLLADLITLFQYVCAGLGGRGGETLS